MTNKTTVAGIPDMSLEAWYRLCDQRNCDFRYQNVVSCLRHAAEARSKGMRRLVFYWLREAAGERRLFASLHARVRNY